MFQSQPPTLRLALITVCCAIAVAGCANNPVVPEVEDAGSQSPIEREITETPAAEEEQAPRTSAATQALIASAEASSQTSDYATAINYLERAIRLEPRNPRLWINIGQAYLNNAELANASQHLRKAIALASGDEDLTREAWLAYADLREAQGYASEARSLRRRWRSGRG